MTLESNLSVNLQLVPNTDEGNLWLYQFLYEIRDSYEAGTRGMVKGFDDSLDEHVMAYNRVLKEMLVRGLYFKRCNGFAIEQAMIKEISNEMVPEQLSRFHCPICGNKLAESDISKMECGECHGHLPLPMGDLVMKPLGPFANWDECMAHMTKPKKDGGEGYDEETARKVCGKMEQQGKK
jgi:hypothetical protein